MESTISRMAKRLGATSVEAIGHDARFAVVGAAGDRLTVSLEGQQQRFMAVLIDAQGVTRTSVDVAPVNRVIEDDSVDGRVTLVVRRLAIQIDTQPSLAIEISTIEEG
jgi:hypothetical protein